MLDQEIISSIQQGGVARERALKELFNNSQLRKSIIELIKANSGTIQDGEDMLQEGFIVLDRNIRNGEFRGDSKIHSYLISICKFLWMNELRKNKKINLTDDSTHFDSPVTENALNTLMNEELATILDELMSKLGDRCQKVLKLWQLNYSMVEIATQVGLSSEGMARKVKHQCYQQLVELVKINPIVQQYKNI